MSTHIHLSPMNWLKEADLADLLAISNFENRWIGNVDIWLDYMPTFAQPDTQPKKVVIRFQSKTGQFFLRYSAGPLQGFFWDVYGDDFKNVGLALRALITAPPPPNPVYGLPSESTN